MSIYCPNKNTDDFQRMSNVLGDKIATAVWYENQGQPIWNTPDGSPSPLWGALMNNPGVTSEAHAMQLKSRIYTKTYQARYPNRSEEPTEEQLSQFISGNDELQATINLYKEFKLVDKNDPNKPIKWTNTDANYKKVLGIAQKINQGSRANAKIINVSSEGKAYITIQLTPKAAFTTEEGERVAFFDPVNGEITFSEKGLTAETVIHEFSHPFVDALAKDNPELFNNLLDEIRKDAKVPEIKKILDHVDTHYAEAGSEIKDKELLAYTLSEYGKGNIDPATGTNTKEAIKRFYQWLTTLAKDLMNQMRSKKTLYVNQIHPKTKYKEVADLFTVYSELGDINLGTSEQEVKKIDPATITEATSVSKPERFWDASKMHTSFSAGEIKTVYDEEGNTHTISNDYTYYTGAADIGKGGDGIYIYDGEPKNRRQGEIPELYMSNPKTSMPNSSGMSALQKRMAARRGNNNNETPPAYKMIQSIPPSFVELKDEATHMATMLPKEIAINLTPGYIKVLSGGRAVVGLFENAMIQLSQKGPKGTAYHEGFHAVFRTLSTTQEQNAVISEARRMFVKPTSKDIFDAALEHNISEEQAEVLYYEEQLADAFAEFMEAPNRQEYSEGIKGFFQKLGDWITEIFSSRTRVDKLFRNIKLGKYTKQTPNIVRGVAYKVHPIFNVHETQKIVRELTSIAFQNVNTVEDLKATPVTLNTIADTITDVALEAEANNDTELIERLDLLFNQTTGEIDNFWIREIDYYLRNSLGLKRNVNKTKASDKITEEDQDEQNAEDLDTKNFLRSSYEVSGKVNATTAIKFMVAMTTKVVVIDKTKAASLENITQEISPLTGLPVLVDFGILYNDLENILSGIVSTHLEGELQDPLVLMLQELKKHTKYKPELISIVDKLDNASDTLRSQFFNAFSRQKGSFLHHQIKGKLKGDEGISSEFTSSNFSTKSVVIRDGWVQGFTKEFGKIEDKELVYNASAIELFFEKRNQFLENVRKDVTTVQNGVGKTSPAVLKEFKTLLSSLGVNLSPETLNYIIEANMPEEIADGYFNIEYSMSFEGLVLDFLNATNDLEKRTGSLYGNNNHIMDNGRFFKDILAEAEAYFKKIPGENSFVGPEGNSIYAYQDNDLVSKAINQMKAGDLTHLHLVANSAYGKYSVWAKELLDPINGESNRKDFEILMYGNLKADETAGDTGAKASDLKPIDAYVDVVNKQLSGFFIGLAEADKSRQTYFKGPKIRRSEFTITPEGKYKMSSKGEGARILKGYLADELSRMAIAYDVVRDGENTKALPENEWKLNYHYYEVAPGEGSLGVNKDRIPGNAFYSFLFPDMDLKKLGLMSPEGKPIRKNNSNFWENEEVNKEVVNAFARLVKAEMAHAYEIGLLSKGNAGEYVNKFVSTSIINDPKRGYTQGGAIDITRVMADYVLNSLIGNIEQTKMFNGDPAGYKVKGVDKIGTVIDDSKPSTPDNIWSWGKLNHFSDFMKRIPAIFASGKDFRIFSKADGTPVVRPHYTSATIANITVPSAFFGSRSAESYSGMIIPEEDTIFVFGSNPEGRHGKGAAKVAVDKFGANYGQGEGLQGNAYALPTKDLRVTENNGLRSISPSAITASIKKMYATAEANPNKKFKVGYTNSASEITLNGYSGAETIAMFNEAGLAPTNVIFSDVWVNSGLMTNLQNTGKVVFNKENMEEVQKVTGLPMKELEALFRPYLKINQTDAQAWITLDAYRERMHGLGKWTAAHDKAYEQAVAGENMDSTSVKLLAQPLKTVHAELVLTKNGELLMEYNKQSEAVLLPFMKDMEIGQLMKAMENPNNPIDHVIVLDGKKAGAQGIVDITDSNGKIMSAKDIKMNAVKLSYNNLFLQQDLPTKLTGAKLLGSQVTKNVLSVVKLDGDYFNDLNGQEVLNLHHSTIGRLSDKGLIDLDESIDYDKETGKFGSELDPNKESKVHKLVKKEYEGELSENQLEAIDKGIAFDALPIKNGIMNKLLSVQTKKAVRLEQQGAALIQLSDLGFIGSEVKLNDKVKNGIIWFKDPTERLSPMAIKNGEVKAAQILMPHSKIVEMLSGTSKKAIAAQDKIEEKFGTRDFKELTHIQLKSIIETGVLEGLSYRIPNQAAASNDAFEIVGILPIEMGDTMIAFSDITTKTGSDFDIDKAFIVLPNFYFDEKEGKIRKIGYDLSNLDKASKSSLENLRLDLMREMLMHPSAYASVMAPLDVPWLEDFAKELFPEKSKLRSMEFFTGRHQLEVKATFDGAKALVGAIANHMTNHSAVLAENLAFNDYYLGKGIQIKAEEGIEVTFERPELNIGSSSISNKFDENGEEVAGTLGAYMNAIVDAAKDPFIVRANLNQYTAGTAFMLARLGVEREWGTAFIGQPIIRDVVAAQAAAEGRLGEPVFSKAQGKYLSPVETVLEKYGLIGVAEADFKSNEKYPSMREHEKADIKVTTAQLVATVKNVDMESDGYKKSQLKVLKQFLEWRVKASQLNDVIKVSKVDVDGATKTLMTAHLAKNLFNKVLTEGNITNLHSYFGVGRDEKGDLEFFKGEKGKMVGRYFDNSINAAIERFSRFFIAGSKASLHVVENVAEWAGYTELITNEKIEQLVYTISNEVYTSAAFDTRAFDISAEEFNNMLYGSGPITPGGKGILPLASRLTSAKHSEFAENLLISGLQLRIGRDGAPDKIYLPNTETVKDTKEALFQAWQELLGATGNPDIQKLAVDLIKYSFYTTGFSKSVGDFSEHIPNEWLELNEFHSDMTRKNLEYIDPYALEGIEDKIFKNLYKNNQLVPTVKKDSDTPIVWKAGGEITLSQDFGFLLTQQDSLNYIVGEGPNGKIFKRYVKKTTNVYNKYGDATGKEYKLYKLAGYTKNNSAVYLRTNTLGVSGYGNNVKEYIGDGNTSVFPQNNVTLPEGLRKLSEVLEQRGLSPEENQLTFDSPEGLIEDRISFCIMK